MHEWSRRMATDIVYQDVISAMDAARGAGVKVIGAVLPDQEKALGL